MKPIAYVDIDGVILQLNEGIRQVLSEKNISFHPENQTDYNYGGNIGCDKKYIYDCFSDINIYKKAPLAPDIHDTINLLREYADVYGWSHITPIPELKDERIRLCKNLGIKPLLFEFPKEEKKVNANVSAVFDDYPLNLEKWIGLNANLYLIRQPYNRYYNNQNIIIVNDLKEGVMHFINHLQK